MPKICITMAFLCFILLVQPNSIKARQDSNSRYLLVELDGSPDMDPGSDVATEEPEMPEPEEEPTDDLEPGTLPEDDEERAISEIGEPMIRKSNAETAQQGGYRSKTAPKPKGKQSAKAKEDPPVKSLADCNEKMRCIPSKDKTKNTGAAGRWWTACQAYPRCIAPNYYGCYYIWGPHTFCMY